MLWYSTMHRISWSFSSSSCGTERRHRPPRPPPRPGRLEPKQAGRACGTVRPSLGSVPTASRPSVAHPLQRVLVHLGPPALPLGHERHRHGGSWLRGPGGPALGRAHARWAPPPPGTAPRPARPGPRRTNHRRRAACTEQFILV